MDESGATIMDGSSTWAADAFAVLRHVLLRQQWNDTDYRSSTKATIADIFERTRGYQATDKRDQVFAIRDLLSEEDKEQFPAPDYAKQCSEVYQEATVAFIRSKKNLAFLMHAIEKDDLELGLPSWCVDFSKRLWDWGGYGNFAEGRESELTPEYMSALSHDPSAGTLKVLGGLLGQVAVPCPLVPVSASIQDQTVTVINAHTLRPEEPDSIPQMYMQFIREVLRISAMSYRIWAHRHDPQTAKERIAAGRVWKMVFGGGILFNAVDAVCVHQNLEKVDGDDRPREYWVVEAFVRKTCPWYADAIEGLGFFHPTPELPDSRRLMEALLATMIVTMRSNIGYWWCLVDTGYIARIEREVREGDRLYTIFGCRQPVVLRPCDGGYQLVAMAYSEDFYEDYHRTYEREVEREIITLR
ncbi:hypothetical protein GQ53DRAFT_817845 [Thozetella sp. PMI_491]|nr:hypothetical protein GQ53DRAFT_817845 [Thozetella sp. PMI_491]